VRRLNGSWRARAAGPWCAVSTAAALLAAAVAAAGAPPPLIPVPASLEPRHGAFEVFPTTPVLTEPRDAGERAVADGLVGALDELRARSLCATPASAIPRARGNPVRLLRRDGFAAEGYALEVAPAAVTITASTDAGLFYGAQTLVQLLPPAGSLVPHRGCRSSRLVDASAALAAVAIRDEPRFRWRGVMLDSARHLQSPEFIRALLDAMAGYKLNVLHWHLTDDQGWRLEIRRYPRLTEIGAYRVPAGRAAQRDLDPATGQPRRYGGYYSQATVRELVAYAAKRHIMVVPEIDMPGHAAAALAAYPELGVAPVHLAAVPADWGIYPYVFNVEEPTIEFLQNVLSEVIELFPAPYVHVGGDEVVSSEWRDSPLEQARARELGLPAPAALHGYLVQRIGRFLAAHGKRLSGWDEIIEPGLSTDAMVVSWRGLDGAVAAARRGNDTVLSPWPTLYFDFRQSAAADEPPGRIQVASLKDVYAFDPEPPGLTPDEARHVLGLQGNLWTEHVRNDVRAAHALFPRAAAVAEVGWSPAEKRDWPGFLERVARSDARRGSLGVVPAEGPSTVVTAAADGGIQYLDMLRPASSEFNVRFASVRTTPDRARVTLTTAADLGVIRYALVGSTTADETVYQGPFEVRLPATIRARAELDGESLGSSSAFTITTDSERRRSSAELERCSNGIALALEADGVGSERRPILWLDIMNPCWILRAVALDQGPLLRASVGALPFNYQIGEDVKKIRIGDATTADGELEVHIDGCDTPPAARLPLAPVADRTGVSTLDAVRLPARPGAHDLCLRFARPRLDPMWALDWVELGP